MEHFQVKYAIVCTLIFWGFKDSQDLYLAVSSCGWFTLRWIVLRWVYTFLFQSCRLLTRQHKSVFGFCILTFELPQFGQSKVQKISINQ